MQDIHSAPAAQAFGVASTRAAGDPAGGRQTSAVAWGAILGGAVAALSISLILLVLGAGLGFASVSPWPNAGASVTTFGAVAAIWLVLVQWFSSGVGGYLTGRLRTRWVGMHTHEVFFRDTAHGFIAWALATIVATALFASIASSGLSGATHAAATVASGAAQGAGQGAAQQASSTTDPTGYFVDTLFRSDNPGAAAGGGAAQGQNNNREATSILVTDLHNGQLAANDRTYLGKLVASRTGLSQQDAEARVDQVYGQMKDAETKARQVADKARKATASMSIILALALVIGAFVSSAAAAHGGRLRDEY